MSDDTTKALNGAYSWAETLERWRGYANHYDPASVYGKGSIKNYQKVLQQLLFECGLLDERPRWPL